MPKLQKLPLKGQFAETSRFFLEDNGFKNIETCSDKSVWVGHGIQIFIEPDEIVVDYKPLFELIYNSGVEYGKYIERKTLTNATTNFLQSYGKENKNIYH